MLCWYCAWSGCVSVSIHVLYCCSHITPFNLCRSICVMCDGVVANGCSDGMSVIACLMYVNGCDLCIVFGFVMACSRNIRPASLVASNMLDIHR